MVTSVPANKADLISWLIDEGVRFGLHVEANYANPEDNTVIELSWSINPGQKPALIFSIEEADTMRLATSILHWAGSSTEPKSWMQVCVLMNGSADAFSSFPLPNNVKVYDRRTLATLSRDLEGLITRMVRLLRFYIDDETGVSTSGEVKRISQLAAEWPQGMWSSRLSLKAQTVFEEGVYMFAAENMEDDETEVPVLKPSRKVVPVEVIGGDTSFEGALIRLIEAQDGNLLFSTEHRNYPSIFRLSARESGGDSTLDLWFDVDKSNIPQALRFRELVEGIMSSKMVVFAGPSGEVARLSLD